MRALQVDGPGVVRVTDLADPVPGPGEVVVRVDACGICGSDVHLLDAGGFAPGQVPGHEFAGTIERAGEGVRSWLPGRPVAVNPLGSCGHCEHCGKGIPFLCTARPNLGLNAPGAFAEYVAVPENQLVALPIDLDVSVASRAEPLAVALQAVDLGNVRADDAVLVYGVGTIGLNAILALRLAGAGTVVAVGRSAGRRAAASRVGADIVLDAREVEPADWAEQHGLRFASTYECSGAPGALASAMRMLAPGGSCVQVALGGSVADFDVGLLVGRGLHIAGSCAFSGPVYERAVRHIVTGEVRTEGLTSERVPLDAAPDAFARLRTPGDIVGVLVQPWL